MLRLTADGLEALNLDAWADGMVDVRFEVGAPALRQVTYDRPNADGTIDLTRYVGVRTATATLALGRARHTRRALLDRMAPFLTQDQPTTIHHSEAPGDPVRRLVAKPIPFDVAWENPGLTDLTWSWRTVGEPWLLGEARVVDLTPSPPPPGRTYPLTYPRTYPDVPDTRAMATNAGALSAAWVWTVHGPVNRPALRNEATGDEVSLPGLLLLPGQTAVIDSVTQKVTVDGQVRHSMVDHDLSEWWRVPPKATTPLSMPVASASGDAVGTLAFSDTYYS